MAETNNTLIKQNGGKKCSSCKCLHCSLKQCSSCQYVEDSKEQLSTCQYDDSKEKCRSCQCEVDSKKNGVHLTWCVAHFRDITIYQCGCCECVPGSKSIPPLFSIYKKTTHVFKTDHNEIIPK